jgi:hypothetical protein
VRLRAAVLCDYAEVREGLLTIVSAGVTRLWRSDLPGPMAVFIALVFELDPSERSLPHEVGVVITAPSGAQVAQVRGGLQIPRGADTQFDSDEAAIVSLPLDLRLAGVAEFGWHSIEISGDDQLLGTLRVKVARPPQTPGPTTGPLPLRQAKRPH